MFTSGTSLVNGRDHVIDATRVAAAKTCPTSIATLVRAVDLSQLGIQTVPSSASILAAKSIRSRASWHTRRQSSRDVSYRQL